MKPLVGISCCSKIFGQNGLPNHAASDFCVRAIAELTPAIPILLPAVGYAAPPEDLLDRLDGILLTGSRTDIDPELYGQPSSYPDRLADPGRDATTLPLIRAAIRRHTPILAICRGMQEVNVALGGTLHQRLNQMIGRLDHVHAAPEDVVRRVAVAHPIEFVADGRLNPIAGHMPQQVNSLHNQAIDRLGQGLRIEATAPDGTIEAISHAGSRFVLGVQWHPEFDACTNPFSAAIFRAFGAALPRAAGGERMAAD